MKEDIMKNAGEIISEITDELGDIDLFIFGDGLGMELMLNPKDNSIVLTDGIQYHLGASCVERRTVLPSYQFVRFLNKLVRASEVGEEADFVWKVAELVFGTLWFDKREFRHMA